MEQKIRVVLERLGGEENIAELCRREEIATSLDYSWSKEFLEAGKKRLAGDTAREATSPEVKTLRAEAAALKEAVADLTLKDRLLKKSMLGERCHHQPGRRRDQRGGGIPQEDHKAGPALADRLHHLEVIGWGCFNLSTILDDYSRYIVASLTVSGCESATVADGPRLLSDNGIYEPPDGAELIDIARIDFDKLREKFGTAGQRTETERLLALLSSDLAQMVARDAMVYTVMCRCLSNRTGGHLHSSLRNRGHHYKLPNSTGFP